jgi:nucleoside-triphosphatase THEP1
VNDSPISPATMLANVVKKKDIYSIWLISGERQAGKTTWCASVAHQAKATGLIVGGLISPAVFQGGEKIGFDLVDLQSGERRVFGVSKHTNPEWNKIGIWSFDPGVINWANEHLKLCQGCDLLILDEVGPLEFNQNQGFQEGMRLVDEHLVQTAFLVIRPELLLVAQKRWPQSRVIEIKKE